MFGVKQKKRCNNRCTVNGVLWFGFVVCSFGKKECQNWFADSFIATVFGNLRQCVVQRRCSNRYLLSLAVYAFKLPQGTFNVHLSDWENA